MTRLNRRRFLSISSAAGACALAGGPAAAGAPLYRWRGIAMGADAEIILRHPEAERIVAMALDEIARLEGIFSLYRADSALSRLNAAGELAAPPFELLECLGLCGGVNAATGGLFDPTIQPLWALYAEHHARGAKPAQAEIDTVRARIGWSGVSLDTARIRLTRPGMALTLNGVAQGYIADRVADLLADAGLHDILVNAGEFRALGGHPDGGGWPIALDTGEGLIENAVALRARALASSAPRGTVFDAEGQVGHILDPRSGAPAPRGTRLISVTAPRAALADALSTAMCLMTPEQIDAALARYPGANLLHRS